MKYKSYDLNKIKQCSAQAIRARRLKFLNNIAETILSCDVSIYI